MKMNKSYLLCGIAMSLLLMMLVSQACALVLRSGDKGDDVKQKQAALIQQG